MFDLHLAKKVNNYEIYTGVADVYWVDTTHFRATCPTGKRWFVIGGVVDIEVSATLNITAYDVSDDPLHEFHHTGAATGVNTWPSNQAGIRITGKSGIICFILDVGEYVEMIFGAAQSTAAYASCVVLEVSV